MRSTITKAIFAGLTAILITGCTGGDEDKTKTGEGGDDAKSGPKYDVSHCKEKQEYHFETMGGGKQIYVVTKKEKDHVMYRVDTYVAATKSTMKGKDEQRWPPEVKTGKTPDKTVEAKTGDKPKISKETVEVSGIKFPCKVTETKNAKIWMSEKFPGMIRMKAGGNTTMDLKEVKDG